MHLLTEKDGMLQASVMGEIVELPLPGPGPYASANLLAALATAAALGVDPETASRYPAFYTPPPHRLQVVAAPGGVTIIDDTYNANPTSMRAALKVLRDFQGRRKLAVLGEMAELGHHAPQEHREVAREAAFVDFLFCAGEHALYYSQGARDWGLPDGRLVMASEAMELAQPLQETLREGDVVLVKGSRVARMERLVSIIMREKA